MERLTKKEYYLDLARTVAQRSTCIRRNYGAIIVKDDSVISTGYNGASKGRANCTDTKFCLREKYGVPRGTRYELCRAVHAEVNAIIKADPHALIGSTLYLYGYDYTQGVNSAPIVGYEPCSMCKRVIINSGITKVVTAYAEFDVQDWIDNEETLSEGY